ncbi:MAG: APC family permease, partial [Clostridiales bacterium]
MLPGTDFLPSAGPGGAAVGLLVGALLMIVISASYGYMIVKFPESGGEFIYIMKTFGKRHAFVGAWSLIFAYSLLIPINGTAMGLLFRFFLPGFIQFGKLYNIAGWDVYFGEILVAIITIVLVAGFNMLGVALSGWLQTVTSFLMGASILAVTAAVFLSPTVNFDNLQPLFSSATAGVSYKGIFAVLAIAPWAFVGFDCIPQMAEEYKFSHFKAKMIMFASLLFAACMYICVCTITAMAMPWQELIANNYYWPTGVSVSMTVGKYGLMLMGIAMFCGILSTMNAFFLASSRLIYSVAVEKGLPEKYTKLHPKYQTPTNAILFLCVFSLIGPWFGRQVLSWIIDMTSVGTALVFFYTTAAAAKIA